MDKVKESLNYMVSRLPGCVVENCFSCKNNEEAVATVTEAIDLQVLMTEVLQHPTAPAISFMSSGAGYWRAKQSLQLSGSKPYSVAGKTLGECIQKLKRLLDRKEKPTDMSSFFPALERFIKGCEEIANKRQDELRAKMAQQKLIDERIVAEPKDIYPPVQLFWERKPRWIYVRLEKLNGERHSYCFVDPNNGDYYACGSNGPAKHVRGNIFDEDPFAGVDEHGAKPLPNWRHGYHAPDVVQRRV